MAQCWITTFIFTLAALPKYGRYGFLPSAILAPFPASLARHPGLAGFLFHPPAPAAAYPALRPPLQGSLPLTTPAKFKSSRALRCLTIQFPRRTLKSAKTCSPFPPPAARHSRLPPAVASLPTLAVPTTLLVRQTRNLARDLSRSIPTALRWLTQLCIRMCRSTGLKKSCA
ncbi:hypothetical protein BD410DRAFT_837341 [Rickenella mellea]|uniref:Uncharacterized protein n=1 Tax=Rickenella mellea TaxID=50990 RepID=A0A4Y7QBY9_9AGAM|nr:hypothetical protein BD410DRAFT_837341 [Rickenella mellea]